MLFIDAINKYALWKGIKVTLGTVKGEIGDLKNFGLFLRNCHIEDISVKDVSEYFSLVELYNWKDNSMYKKAIALRNFLEFYTRLGYKVLDSYFVPLPRVQQAYPRFAEEENYRKLLASIPHTTNHPREIRNIVLIMML